MISIIIPVYNAANYLKQGFSWLDHITSNFAEVILVDDGSTDGSAAICDQLSLKYPTVVKVIHKENEGPSAARNSGINIAQGEWITFLDADDKVSNNFKQCLEKINDAADLHVFAIDIVQTGSLQHIDYSDNKYSGREIGKYLINHVISAHPGNGWSVNKVFKRELIGGLRFDTRFNMMEDEIFNQHYLERCNCVKCHSESYYTYIIDNPMGLHNRFHQNYWKIVDNVYGNFIALASQFQTLNALDFQRGLAIRTVKPFRKCVECGQIKDIKGSGAFAFLKQSRQHLWWKDNLYIILISLNICWLTNIFVKLLKR